MDISHSIFILSLHSGHRTTSLPFASFSVTSTLPDHPHHGQDVPTQAKIGFSSDIFFLFPPLFSVSRIIRRADYVRANSFSVPSAFHEKVRVKSKLPSGSYTLIVETVPSAFHVKANLAIFFPIGALVNVLRMASWIDSPAHRLTLKHLYQLLSV